MRRLVFIGYDPREQDAYLVAYKSMRHFSPFHDAHPIVLNTLQRDGLYRRPTENRDGQRWDVISDAPMSTEFAISRFLVPHLSGNKGWALFVDCDVMFRASADELFDLADDRYAVMCVKHTHTPSDPSIMAAVDSGAMPPETKMDGQAQTYYARKNWSSVMLWNLAHPSIQHGLTPDMVNTLPGRDLHRMCWLKDEEIGALPKSWNHLVGVDPPDPKAKIVHHTLGVPSMPGYEDSEFADQWRGWLSGEMPRSAVR